MTKIVNMSGEAKIHLPKEEKKEKEKEEKKGKKVISMSSAPLLKRIINPVKKIFKRKKKQKFYVVSIPKSTRRKMLRMNGRKREV